VTIRNRDGIHGRPIGNKLHYKILKFNRMKKTSIVLIMIVALASCSKEDLVNPTSRKTGLNTSTNTKAASQTAMRVWHDNGTVWGCWDEGGNCLPTVEVPANKIKLINNLFYVVKSGNQSEIIRFFKENLSELTLFFDKETIYNVINGTLVVKDKDENEQKERFILFIFPSTGEISSVNPFMNK
jgi:hypothetical protein